MFARHEGVVWLVAGGCCPVTGEKEEANVEQVVSEELMCSFFV